MGYLIKAPLGLAMFLGGIVLFNVKLVSLLETGTCASGNTPYQISQPCPTGTGTDFVNRRVFKRTCRARDLARQVEIEKKILAQRFLRRQIVARDDIAQRRQRISVLWHRRCRRPF